MIPLPDWSRLIPRKLSRDTTPPHSLAEGLLIIGSFPIIIVGMIAGGSYAADLSMWLAIPGGIIGLSIMIEITGPIVLRGITEAIFYSVITFIFSNGLENGFDNTTSWIWSSVVATLFLLATISVWMKNH